MTVLGKLAVLGFGATSAWALQLPQVQLMEQMQDKTRKQLRKERSLAKRLTALVQDSQEPAAAEAAPAAEEAAPAAEGDAAPAAEGDAAPAAEGDAAPAEEGAAPAEEGAAPAEEGAAPAEEGAAPADAAPAGVM